MEHLTHKAIRIASLSLSATIEAERRAKAPNVGPD